MIQIRRAFTHLEEIRHEFGPVAEGPLLRGAIGAVLTNPFAGRYEPDILPMMDALQDVGLDMAQRLLKAMAVPAERIETYGKGAIVGAAGELEHGALWHVPGGYAMRELLGWKGDRNAYAKGLAEEKTGQPANALSIVPSTKKVGGPGAALDVPLTHINASYVRSHFDAIEVRVPGAPTSDEIVFILAMSTKIRKIMVQTDEVRVEMGRDVQPPVRKALAMAVIENPCAGRYVENLDELVAIGEELGALLGARCVAALGIEPGQAQSYGKAAIVGEAGELEHAAAILHPKLGAPLRMAVEKGAALVPSSKKIGGLGTAIDVPLGHKDAAYVRSHFDAMEARVADAPRANEIVVAIVVTDSGRPLARIGGLQASEIKGEDGLR